MPQSFRAAAENRKRGRRPVAPGWTNKPCCNPLGARYVTGRINESRPQEMSFPNRTLSRRKQMQKDTPLGIHLREVGTWGSDLGGVCHGGGVFVMEGVQAGAEFGDVTQICSLGENSRSCMMRLTQPSSWLWEDAASKCEPASGCLQTLIQWPLGPWHSEIISSFRHS